MSNTVYLLIVNTESGDDYKFIFNCAPSTEFINMFMQNNFPWEYEEGCPTPTWNLSTKTILDGVNNEF